MLILEYGGSGPYNAQYWYFSEPLICNRVVLNTGMCDLFILLIICIFRWLLEDVEG